MISKANASWPSTKLELQQRIGKLRDDLEAPGASPDLLRGEIAALRWVIAQVEKELPDEDLAGTSYTDN